MEDVVLQVERALGQLDEDGAGDERLETRGQQAEGRPGGVTATVCRDARRDPAFESSQVLGRFASR